MILRVGMRITKGALDKCQGMQVSMLTVTTATTLLKMTLPNAENIRKAIDDKTKPSHFGPALFAETECSLKKKKSWVNFLAAHWVLVKNRTLTNRSTILWWDEMGD